MPILAKAILAIFLCSILYADEKKPQNSDEETVKKIYIPKDLNDCFKELNKLLAKGDIDKIKKGKVDAVDMHFGLGMGIRNTWGLWGDSRLAKYFKKHGIKHPDNMSGIILDSYVDHLKGKPINFDWQKNKDDKK